MCRAGAHRNSFAPRGQHLRLVRTEANQSRLLAKATMMANTDFVTRPAIYPILFVQLVGAVLSAFLVIITVTSPNEVEQRLQEFAVGKVEHAATAAWQRAARAPDGKDRVARLENLSEQFGAAVLSAERLRSQLIPALVAHALSDRCNDACNGQALLAIAANSALLSRASAYRVGQQTLDEFIVERYDNTVRGLILDLRLFGLVNLVAFVLMMGLALLRDVLNRRFFALSVGVSGYTIWAAYGYLFEQNWALSILLNDWAAPGYQVSMVIVSAVLADWVFLKGLVTQFIAAALGAAISG